MTHEWCGPVDLLFSVFLEKLKIKQRNDIKGELWTVTVFAQTICNLSHLGFSEYHKILGKPAGMLACRLAHYIKLYYFAILEYQLSFFFSNRLASLPHHVIML